MPGQKWFHSYNDVLLPCRWPLSGHSRWSRYLQVRFAIFFGVGYCSHVILTYSDSSVNNCTAIVDARIIYSVVITTGNSVSSKKNPHSAHSLQFLLLASSFLATSSCDKGAHGAESKTWDSYLSHPLPHHQTLRTIHLLVGPYIIPVQRHPSLRMYLRRPRIVLYR